MFDQAAVHAEGGRHVFVAGQFHLFTRNGNRLWSDNTQLDPMRTHLKYFDVNVVSDDDTLAGPPPYD